MPPELTFERFSFRVYRGPALTASGRADRASFRRDTSELTAERLWVWFLEEAGRPESRVRAARGTGNLDTRRFEARGAVHAEQAGRTADTEVARYSGEDGLVRGDQPVTVRGPGLTVTGPGFALDPRSQILRIEGGARAVSGGGSP